MHFSHLERHLRWWRNPTECSFHQLANSMQKRASSSDFDVSWSSGKRRIKKVKRNDDYCYYCDVGAQNMIKLSAAAESENCQETSCEMLAELHHKSCNNNKKKMLLELWKWFSSFAQEEIKLDSIISSPPCYDERERIITWQLYIY